MSARQFRRARRKELERTASRRTTRLGAAAGAAFGGVVFFAPAADAATFTVSNLNNSGDGSLRDAIEDANATALADDVVFQSGLSGTIDLASEIDITQPVTIAGPGAGTLAISGQDLTRIFYISPATLGAAVSISGLTFRDGSTPGYGGAIASYDAALSISGAAFTDNYADMGGALHSDGTSSTVSITGSTFTENDSLNDGGAVLIDYTAEVASGVTISGSTFTNNATNAGGDGGAIYLDDIGGPGAETGAGILIENTTISGNTGDDRAGGIGFNNLDAPGATIVGTTITGNHSSSRGGGMSVNNADGTVTVRNSVVSGNTAGLYGGGIALNNIGDSSDGGGPEQFLLQNSTIAGNSGGDGGALYLDNLFGGAVIEGSTLSGNSASGDGGGVYLRNSDALLDVRNSTVSNNTADGLGGGFHLGTDDSDEDGATTIRNSTVTGNGAGEYAGGINRTTYDAGATDHGDTVTISSSIVSGNSAPVNPELGADASDAGSFVLQSSLIGNTGIGTEVTESGPNLIGVDPLLGPLADNGGPTQTHAPSVSSPVIDAGIANGLATDQRGAPRTFDAANVANGAASDGTDIGAVELLPGGRLALAQCKGAAENLLFAPGTAIVGTDANDVIVGTPAKDSIKSGKGKDRVCAGGGNDGVKAGSGKDNVAGQAGKDRIKGNGGNDKLQGNAGRDTLKGGGGKDTLKGGGGKDKLRGGPGRDKLKGGGGKDSEVQ